MNNYNFKEIEVKWRNYWLKNKTFKTKEDNSKDFFYALDMFPYPSGSGLHVGHPAGYTATDIISRFKLMQGFNVLHPIGWDAFGLPAEQYAIKTGNHPSEFTKENINTFRKQLQLLGFSYDWDKEIDTTDPEYFKTTQLIFLKLYRKGLAELREVPVNWCEDLSTVLANDEVIEDEEGNKISERGGFLVTQKPMIQWLLKITKYADKLIEGLDSVDWLESTKIMQKNWIQDSETKEMKIRDWLFSRQRYWGVPFPVKHVDGKIQLLKKEELPLKLPLLSNFKGQNGNPALANSERWINDNYDLNTMPGSAGSSWYYLAYILKTDNGYLDIDSPEAKEKLNKWMPVDLYIGGTEHTVGHLLYSRFWNIFLVEEGILESTEPFQKLVHQGMILGTDNKKMSKSKDNVINPDDIIKEYGADSLRAYIMFMGAFEDIKPWSQDGVKSMHKWLRRVWRTILEESEIKDSVSKETHKAYNLMVKEITDCYENYKFNIAISSMMIFINHVAKNKELTKDMAKGFIQCFNPICPHITEEMWSILKVGGELSIATWPVFNEKKLESSEINYIIQVDGKFKGKITLEEKASKEELEKLLKEDISFKELFETKTFSKVIFIKNKLINFVR